MTLRRSLYAAFLILAVTLAWVLLAAHPARADYSDHGTPDVSLIPPENVERTVNSTHPGLATTGSNIGTWAIIGLVAAVVGGVLWALSRKPHHRRTT
jgi:hypothetical protein